MSAQTVERPILFSAPMILALEAGTKTVTRRVMRPQPIISPGAAWDSIEQWDEWEWPKLINGVEEQTWEDALYYCPYGQVGDMLWVRETLKRGPKVGIHDEDSALGYGITYAATLTPVPYAPSPDREGWCGRALWEWKKKVVPSIFMPRWASRFTLRLTDVTMEPVQKISPASAKAEGVEIKFGETYVDVYRALWDSLNAKRGFSWNANPWVWVLAFEVVA